MKQTPKTYKAKRAYFPITLPNGKVKYIRSRIDFELKKTKNEISLCCERR